MQTAQLASVDGATTDGLTGSGSGANNVTITRATPTIATFAAPQNIVLGQTVSDSATVSGRVNPDPGATVRFDIYGPGDVTCSGPPSATFIVAYPLTGSATSPAYAPVQAGVHRWRATYSGDANNDPVAGICNDPSESVVVSKATPVLGTTASANIAVGAGTLTDSVTVSARQFPLAGATVDFRVYGPDNATCSGGADFEALNVVYPLAGGAVTSPPFTPTQPGTYRWVVTYSGDANNNAVAGACDDPGESSAVAIAAPTIASVASPAVVLGAGTLTDTATISGRASPLPGATVEFRLYGPGDTTCAGTPVFTSPPVAVPVAEGPVGSPPFTPAQAGTYLWRALYSGDANNLAVAGACDAANESVVVTRATTTITAAASSGIALGAGVLSDSATVGGRVSQVAGATVEFRLYPGTDPGCIGVPVFTGSAAVDDSGGAVSPAFTPPTPATTAGSPRTAATRTTPRSPAPARIPGRASRSPRPRWARGRSSSARASAAGACGSGRRPRSRSGHATAASRSSASRSSSARDAASRARARAGCSRRADRRRR